MYHAAGSSRVRATRARVSNSSPARKSVITTPLRSAWSIRPPPSFPRSRPTTIFRAARLDEMRPTPREAVVVVGSGPIRIGQGIEFDYSCVHAAWALSEAGRSAVVVNNNPETVSTDFDISDTLVFEPPGAGRSRGNVPRHQAPRRDACLRRTDRDQSRRRARAARRDPSSAAIAVRSTWPRDREQFEAALARLGVARPEGRAARSFREARVIARELGFPVLVRPSFVLGGRAMEIVHNEAQLAAYAEIGAADSSRCAAARRQVSARAGGRGRRGLRRRGDSDSRHLRARRTRRRPLRRFDQRLSGADARCGNGGARCRGHAGDRARVGHPRADQHSVRRARRRASTLSKPTRVPAAPCRSFRRRPESISSPPRRASRWAKNCATWSRAPGCGPTFPTSSLKCRCSRFRRCAASRRCSGPR